MHFPSIHPSSSKRRQWIFLFVSVKYDREGSLSASATVYLCQRTSVIYIKSIIFKLV